MSSQRTRSVRLARLLAASLLIVPCSMILAEDQNAPDTQPKGSTMPDGASRVTGKFDVKLAPLGAEPGADPSLGRMSIAKQFHGDLEGVSQGQMLTGMTAVKGSAGYVAIERFTGTLAGRKGSFTLQHYGIMDRGQPALTVTVIPDSGTDELVGLTGSMTIDIKEGGAHFYTFEYTLPPAEK